MEPAHPEQRIQTVCLITLTLIAVGAALYWLRPVLTPFVLAVFLAAILMPLRERLQRTLRLPSSLALVGTILVAAGLLLVLMSLVAAAGGQVVAGSETYQTQVLQLIERLTLRLEEAGLDPDEYLDPLRAKIPDFLTTVATGALNGVRGLLSSGFLVLIFLIFLLAGQRGDAPHPGGMVGEVEGKIRTYLTVKVTVSALTGVLVYAILRLLGVDFALAFGLFTFLLNFIPNVGSVIAVMLPLPVVLVSPDVSTAGAILAIVLPGIIQFSVGNLIEPRFLGQSLDLHPIAVLMSLIFWGMLWGFLGMVLSVPMAAVTKLVFERNEYTRPLAELLAGRIPESWSASPE